jgi:hypothetical protein
MLTTDNRLGLGLFWGVADGCRVGLGVGQLLKLSHAFPGVACYFGLVRDVNAVLEEPV